MNIFSISWSSACISCMMIQAEVHKGLKALKLDSRLVVLPPMCEWLFNWKSDWILKAQTFFRPWTKNSLKLPQTLRGWNMRCLITHSFPHYGTHCCSALKNTYIQKCKLHHIYPRPSITVSSFTLNFFLWIKMAFRLGNCASIHP